MLTGSAEQSSDASGKAWGDESTVEVRRPEEEDDGVAGVAGLEEASASADWSCWCSREDELDIGRLPATSGSGGARRAPVKLRLEEGIDGGNLGEMTACSRECRAELRRLGEGLGATNRWERSGGRRWKTTALRVLQGSRKLRLLQR